MKVKAVLFDLFDTLVIIKGGETFYEPALKKLHNTLVENGIKTDYDTFRRIYFQVRDKLYEQSSRSLKEPHFNVRLQQTLAKLGYRYETCDATLCEASNAFADEFMRYAQLDPRTVPLLQNLQGKYKLAIMSNFAIPDALLNMLRQKGLDTYFDAIVISGAVNRRKPNPEIFHTALRLLRTKPNEAIFVGDTPYTDIRGAKNVGMKAVLIERTTAAIDTPKDTIWKPVDRASPPADYTIKSLDEITRIVTDC